MNTNVVYLKTYSLTDIRKAAKKRPAGYLDAVLAAAVKVTETHVTLDAKDAARITREYGGGIPVTRKPTDAEKGDCGGCGSGKAKTPTARNMDQWHKAMEIPE